MRFKLTLQPIKDRQQLLFNYQYPLQAWIYGILNRADSDYADFLHGRGYDVPESNKTFKHFTFSALQIPRTEPIQKGAAYMTLRSEYISLIISFHIDKAAADFVVGLFEEQRLPIFNRDYRADFVVERVETLPDLVFSEKATFKTLSAMVIAERIDAHDQYLSPNDASFGRFFALNLADKHRSLYPDSTITAEEIRFELISDPERIKKRGFLTKEGKEHFQTQVIGYHNFTFRVTAPPKVIETGYHSGFGRYCSTGCGCVEIGG